MEGVSVGAVAEYLQDQHALTQRRYSPKQKSSNASTSSQASELNDALYKVRLLVSYNNVLSPPFKKGQQTFSKLQKGVGNS